MLSLMIAATAILSPYGNADELVTDITPTLSYQVVSDEYNIAINVFAFMKKPMYITYQNKEDCSYKDETPVYENDDVYTLGLKPINLAEKSDYQMTVYPIRKIDDSIETLMIFLIPEKSKNELYKLDENCSLELGEKVFKKYTIIQKFKLNEMTPMKVGEKYVEVKLIELKTEKEQL